MPTETKTCEWCGQDISHKKERSAKFCGRACFGKWYSHRASSKPKPTKECEWCEKEYPKRQHGKLWENQKFCSIQCRNAYANTIPRKREPRKTKLCARCEKEFPKPYGIGATGWEKRKYCSKTCDAPLSGILQKRGYGPKEVRIQTRTRDKLLKLGYYRPCCEICGWFRAIELAHIVEAHKGGPMLWWNVLTLCPNHHVLFDKGLLTDEEEKGIEDKLKTAHGLFAEFIKYSCES